MITLGINAAFHDSSACLVRDGAVIAAAEEERFTRIKHGKRPLPFTVWELPYHAIDYCLAAGGAELGDVEVARLHLRPSLARRADALLEVVAEDLVHAVFAQAHHFPEGVRIGRRAVRSQRHHLVLVRRM